MTSLQSAATNTENIVDRAGQATRNLARQGQHLDNMFTLQYYHIIFSVLSYLGLATDVQTQDHQLLVKENLVDDKKVVEELDGDEEEDGEADEEEEEEKDESLDFLQNFPNFYSMAADIMNQLDGNIPEVLDKLKI